MSVGRTIPGVTAEAPWKRKLPSVLEALKKPAKSDERAKALTAIADEWFRAWTWYVAEATECEAHYYGEHWGFLQPSTGLWIGNTLDSDPDRVRITVNVTKACVDQAVAMMTSDAAIIKAAAGQPGIAAAAAAETARAFLDDMWRFHNLDGFYKSTAKAAFMTGTSFVLLEWDKTVGPLQIIGYKPVAAAGLVPPTMPSGVGEDGELVAPPQAPDVESAELSPGDERSEALACCSAPAPGALPAPDVEPIEEPQGELRYRQLMREQVAYDPCARKRGGQDGIGVCVKWRESRAKILEIRPDLFDDLPESGARSTSFGSSEESVHRTAGNARASNEKQSDDTLEVIVFYLRSRPDRRRGDCIMVCEGKVLFEGENDMYPTREESARGELWPADNWPLFDFIADERENCPLGRARTVDAIPIQHAINGCFSKLIQHIGIMANVKYVLPAGMDWEPNDEPGQVARIATKFWQMTGGKPVQMTSPPQISTEYIQGAENLISKLEYVIGVNAASMGNAPSADPSGRAIQGLQQRDATRIAPLKRDHDNRWASMQNYALRLVRRHAKKGRILRVVGADQSVQMKFFEIADLAAGTEVYSVNDTSLPRDPQQRILAVGTVMDKLAQAKSPEIQDAYLELLRLPDLTDWMQRRSPHQTKALRNNRLLLLGEGDGTTMPPPAPTMPGQPMPPAPPPNCPLPAPWDNAMIHKAELERFLCSPDYLDRVKAEKQDPANMTQSPLEQRATWLWTYWAQHSMPQPAPGAPSPGVSPQGAPTSAPVPEAMAA